MRSEEVLPQITLDLLPVEIDGLPVVQHWLSADAWRCLMVVRRARGEVVYLVNYIAMDGRADRRYYMSEYREADESAAHGRFVASWRDAHGARLVKPEALPCG